jgi:hypothetical protein
MTEYQKEKLSKFLDDLIEFRFDVCVFDAHRDKKFSYWSIDIDTTLPIKSVSQNNFTQFQKIHFAVSPDSGMVLLYKDNFDEYSVEDLEFAKKYSKIIQSCIDKKMNMALDNLIDSSYLDLKLHRDSNIKKLIE